MPKTSRETKQKVLMKNLLENMNEFFTAEEFHSKVLKDHKDIGIATIYRFLKELSKNNEIHSFTCDRKALYSKQKHQHSHFICEKCGIKYHITLKELDFLSKNIPGKICHFQIDVHGTCKNCLLRENNKN